MSRQVDMLGLYLHQLGFVAELPFAGLSGRRRFRWDWAHCGCGVAVEYDGVGVGHQSIAGTWRDAEKSNEGQLCGWLVIRCNARTVEDGRCLAWIEAAMHLHETTGEHKPS